MSNVDSLSVMKDIMMEFSAMTGLSPAGDRPPRRYLWTDAFAVCNFLGLYLETKDPEYKRLALLLIDQVHHVLGRHRKDDRRTGWISGLNEQEGEMHPTRGGLRIGKKLNEMMPAASSEDPLEWDRDGQYYHYLTKWMHALDRASSVSGISKYRFWAIELAKTAHAEFTYTPFTGRQKRMYWKMTIDLSYPLVKSMGHHDPLDGLITYHQLQAGRARDPQAADLPDLQAEIVDMAAICAGKDWDTDDPLGIGGILTGCFATAQLIVFGGFPTGLKLLEETLESSIRSLKVYVAGKPLERPAARRLAFRELGLSIGLHAVESLRQLVEKDPGPWVKAARVKTLIESLSQYGYLSKHIDDFWLEPGNRESDTWGEHLDINRVMLATSLLPRGYLELRR